MGFFLGLRLAAVSFPQRQLARLPCVLFRDKDVVARLCLEQVFFFAGIASLGKVSCSMRWDFIAATRNPPAVRKYISRCYQAFKVLG